MPKLTRRQLIILTLGGFLSYLLFGMFDSMRGATLSVLLTDLDLSYTAGGSVVMGQYAGYFAATLLVGILADRTGPKFTLVLAACSLIFGVAGYAASSGLPALIAFIFTNLQSIYILLIWLESLIFSLLISFFVLSLSQTSEIF